jgi:hypothetical protein
MSEIQQEVTLRDRTGQHFPLLLIRWPLTKRDGTIEPRWTILARGVVWRSHLQTLADAERVFFEAQTHFQHWPT